MLSNNPRPNNPTPLNHDLPPLPRILQHPLPLLAHHNIAKLRYFLIHRLYCGLVVGQEGMRRFVLGGEGGDEAGDGGAEVAELWGLLVFEV